MSRAAATRVRLARPAVIALRLSWHAHRRAFAGQLAVTVFSGLAPVASAWLLRDVLDMLVRQAPAQRLLVAAFLLCTAGGLQTVLPFAGQYLSAQADRACQRRTATELFGAVNRLLGLRRLEDPGFHDRLNVARQAGSSAPGQIFSGGVTIIQSALTLTGFVITLAVLAPGIAALVLAAAIPGLCSELDISRRRAAIFSGLSHAQRRQYFYADLLTDYAAAKEIRLFGLGEFFRRRLLGELRAIHRESERVDRRALAVHTALALLGALTAAGGLLWAVFAAAHGKLTVGDVSVFVVALTSASSSLRAIVTSAALTHQSLLMFDSYIGVLAEGPDLARPPGVTPAEPLRHGIELADVWFRYGPDQPWILRGVSLFIPSGQAVAVVGRNGAGKSTLVKLLCRCYDPERGVIRWDGVDLRDIEVSSLRDRISAVFQDFMRYELSAAENIEVGDLSQADSRPALTAAASRAGVHDALTALPKGYDTMLTRTYFDLADRDNPETGVLLSGGQWQRLGLARALLRGDRDLLILDEPSSGLDAEAEHQIHARLRWERRDHATILISHRLNAVRDADHIVVLDDGVISEQGSHDALMALAGLYARLFCLQAKGYAQVATAADG